MKASGRAAARRWVAFQPVQWPGTNRSTPRSVRGGDGGADDRLEDGPGEVEAANEAGDLVAAGEAPGVLEDVDGAGVGAGRHHHQALAGDVDDQVLVVEDQRVELPAVAGRAAPPA
jgi:hypothetical protein